MCVKQLQNTKLKVWPKPKKKRNLITRKGAPPWEDAGQGAPELLSLVLTTEHIHFLYLIHVGLATQLLTDLKQLISPTKNYS